jgi:hypothetical protein
MRATRTEDDILLTTPEIGRRLGRRASVIWTWVVSGRLKPAGETLRGGLRVATYRLSEARAIDSTAKRMHKDSGESKRAIKPASKPTFTTPGSESRIRVYCERFARNESIFHDGDSRITSEAA